MRLLTIFYRHLAQVFRVKMVQSVFRITLEINTIVIVFLVTREDTAKQVSLGLLCKRSIRNNNQWNKNALHAE